jgi:hypothetical protein
MNEVYLLAIWTMFSLSDIVSIKELTMLKTVGQCDIKYMMTL